MVSTHNLKISNFPQFPDTCSNDSAGIDLLKMVRSSYQKSSFLRVLKFEPPSVLLNNSADPVSNVVWVIFSCVGTFLRVHT